MICEINGTLYRFDYGVGNDTGNKKIVTIVNGILTVMSAAVFLILLYIRKEILSPFERLKDVPYELSKGNLTFPVRENKNRFFGKFLWGIDMLRESMEQQKRREFELEKEKKTLLLSLSHDIKTPLSAIKLYAKALSRNLYSDREKQCETAEKINDKADEIERYVSRIITASREDFLSLEAEEGEFYLGELVRNITAYYSEKLAFVKTEFIIGEYQDCLLSGNGLFNSYTKWNIRNKQKKLDIPCIIRFGSGCVLAVLLQGASTRRSLRGCFFPPCGAMSLTEVRIGPYRYDGKNCLAVVGGTPVSLKVF